MGYYSGISAHYSVPAVRSYAEALAVLEAQRSSKAKFHFGQGFPLGHSKSVCYVRALGMTEETSREADATTPVAFRLYQTDVVTWFPDDSVVIDNFGSATTSDFARRFLPPGIWLSYPTIRGGHKGIYYRAAADKPWWEARVVFGNVVRFVPAADGLYVPDPETCETMRFPRFDTRLARAATRRHHLKDFESWLSMAPQHLQLEHHMWDMGTCEEALAQRDFRTAAIHLPLIRTPQGFGGAERMKPLPIATGRWDEHVTMGSVRKLKLALWEMEGALQLVEMVNPTRAEFDRLMARVREMDALGLRSDLGPSELRL